MTSRRTHRLSQSGRTILCILLLGSTAGCAGKAAATASSPVSAASPAASASAVSTLTPDEIVLSDQQQAMSAATSNATQTVSRTAGCSAVTIDQQVKDPEPGLTYLTGRLRLTDRIQVVEPPTLTTPYKLVYTEVELVDVTVISGADASKQPTSAWVLGGHIDGWVTTAEPSAATAWATDGQFFGELYPAEGLPGMALLATPVIDGMVLATQFGCWTLEGTAGTTALTAVELVAVDETGTFVGQSGSGVALPLDRIG